jgi:hypothetical protein
MGILPSQGKNPRGRAGNRNRDLMISSEKRRPLDHEAGRTRTCNKERSTGTYESPCISISTEQNLSSEANRISAG